MPKIAKPGFATDNDFYKEDAESRLVLDREKIMMAEQQLANVLRAMQSL
jgi:hypothetical protein